MPRNVSSRRTSIVGKKNFPKVFKHTNYSFFVSSYSLHSMRPRPTYTRIKTKGTPVVFGKLKASSKDEKPHAIYRRTSAARSVRVPHRPKSPRLQ